MERHLEHLAAVPLFSGASDKELAQIAQLSTELELEEGAVLMRQGEVGREAFVVVEGRALVERDGEAVAEIGPGACVGELALLDQGPRTATVVALGPMKVLVMNGREFSSLLMSVPGIALKLLSVLADRLRAAGAHDHG